jgi:hypothetical protein
MTETPGTPTDTSSEADSDGDELRQHPEDPAEGAEPGDANEADVPREHPEGASEG